MTLLVVTMRNSARLGRIEYSFFRGKQSSAGSESSKWKSRLQNMQWKEKVSRTSRTVIRPWLTSKTSLSSLLVDEERKVSWDTILIKTNGRRCPDWNQRDAMQAPALSETLSMCMVVYRVLIHAHTLQYRSYVTRELRIFKRWNPGNSLLYHPLMPSTRHATLYLLNWVLTSLPFLDDLPTFKQFTRMVCAMASSKQARTLSELATKSWINSMWPVTL